MQIHKDSLNKGMPGRHRYAGMYPRGHRKPVGMQVCSYMPKTSQKEMPRGECRYASKHSRAQRNGKQGMLGIKQSAVQCWPWIHKHCTSAGCTPIGMTSCASSTPIEMCQQMFSSSKHCCSAVCDTPFTLICCDTN